MKDVSLSKATTVALAILGLIIGFTSMELLTQITLLTGNN